jgi:hypothetical protein
MEFPTPIHRRFYVIVRRIKNGQLPFYEVELIQKVLQSEGKFFEKELTDVCFFFGMKWEMDLERKSIYFTFKGSRQPPARGNTPKGRMSMLKLLLERCNLATYPSKAVTEMLNTTEEYYEEQLDALCNEFGLEWVFDEKEKNFRFFIKKSALKK